MRRPALPPLLDGRDQLALAHPRGSGDANRLGDSLKFGQQHRRQSPGLAARAARGIRAGPVVACGRVYGIRPGAYRANRVVGSPHRMRHADRLTVRPRQASRIPILSREQVQGFAHKGSFPGCGSRPRLRPAAHCRVAICHRCPLAARLAGRPGRGSVPQGSALTRSLARAGQTGRSRDGQMNFEIARHRGLGRQSEEVRTSTCPQGGASGAATSLTPT